MARRARESAHFRIKIFSSHLVPLGCGPCLRRTGHPFAASGRRGPSQKIELVFSASPETVSGEPKESLDFRRSLGQGRDLAACALYDLEIFLSLRFLCRNAGETAYRFKVSLLAIYNHEICNQLASYGECCTVGIPLLPCVFIYQSQIGIPPWGQLGRFDEHPLDMFVSLLRNRSTGLTLSADRFSSPQSPQ